MAIAALGFYRAYWKTPLGIVGGLPEPAPPLAAPADSLASPPSQTTVSSLLAYTAPTAARTVVFPADRSVGQVAIRDWASEQNWETLGEGRGSTTVPPGKELGLLVSPDSASDLTFLDTLAPDVLQVLAFQSAQHATVQEKGPDWQDYYSPSQQLRALNFAPIKRFTPLRMVILSHCEVTRPMITSLTELPHLAALEIQYTWPSDDIFLEFPKLTSLQYLDMSRTSLSDAALEYTGKMTSLRELDLDCTPVTDAGVRHLRYLTNLERLSLGFTGITDRSLEEVICNLTNLRALGLEGTSVTDAGMVYLSRLGSLEDLWSAGTRVGNEGVRSLSGLPSLRKLRIQRTGVDDGAVPWLSQITSLEYLGLTNTQVSPAGIAQLRQSLPNCLITS